MTATSLGFVRSGTSAWRVSSAPVDPLPPYAGRVGTTGPARHPAVGVLRGSRREWVVEPDRDGVRARRPALRLRAGRASAGHQERRAAADAVSHRDRQLRPASAACSASPSIPNFATNQLCVRLLHGHDAGDPQPHQPLHRQRRRRGRRQRGRHPRPRQPEQRDQPQRRRARTSARTASCTSAVGENANGQPTRSRWATCSARCCASTRTARSPPTTRSTARRPARTARSGRWGCATRSRSRSTRQAPPHVHQRRGPEHLGGDQRRHRRRQLRLADDGRTRRRTRASRVPDYAYAHANGACAITGGAFYAPLTAHFPAAYFKRLLLRGLLRRLDPEARSRRGTLWRTLQPASLPGGFEGRRRWSAVLPRAREWPHNRHGAIGSSTAPRLQASRSTRPAERLPPEPR